MCGAVFLEEWVPLTDEAEGRRQSANTAEKYDHVGQGKDVRIEVM